MKTDNQIPTLAEILQEMRDKVDLAKLSLMDMEQAKSERSIFIQRLNIYLFAIGSVTLILKRQGEPYAWHVKKGQQFLDWYKEKEDLFRKPGKGKKGTNPTWVYLEAARDVTTHQHQVKPYDAYRATRTVSIRVHIHTNAEEAEREQALLSQQHLPTAPDLVEEAVRNDEKIYLFKPLDIIERGKFIETLPPPNDDVISVCKNHIQILESLIAECKTRLE